MPLGIFLVLTIYQTIPLIGSCTECVENGIEPQIVPALNFLENVAKHYLMSDSASYMLLIKVSE